MSEMEPVGAAIMILFTKRFCLAVFWSEVPLADEIVKKYDEFIDRIAKVIYG